MLFLCAAPAPARKDALPAKYDRWLNEEVVYLISDQERKAFLKLNTDAAREQFIQEFWEARNLARGSGRNPVKEEHYRRLEYANRNFGLASNTPGWKTDMGRTYILLGKPESRAVFKGYSQLYPIELWFYKNSTGNPSLPPFFYLLFYIPDNIGEYRYYRPFADGPLKLARGTQFQTNRDVYEFLKTMGGDLARAAFSLVPGDPLDTEQFTPSMAGDLLVARIQNYANDPWEQRRLREARELRAKVTSWFLVPDEQPLPLVAAVLADPQGEYWLDFAVLVGDEKLGTADGRGNLAVSSGFRLFTDQGALAFEDSSEAAYPAYKEGAFQPFLLARRIPLVPGRYRLEAQVVNRAAGRSWKVERVLVVEKTLLTEPVLIRSTGPVRQSDSAAPFQYFGMQFVPAGEPVFSPRDPLRVLFQLLPGGEGRDLELEYVVAHAQDRNLRRVFRETAAAGEFRDGRLLKAKTLTLEGCTPGAYRLVVTVRQQGSQQALASANVGFEIRESSPVIPLYFAGTSAAGAPPVAAYLRALACMAQNDSSCAEAHLQRAVEPQPSHADAVRMLAGLYFQSARYDQVASLYQRAGQSFLAAYPDSAAQVVVSLAQIGETASAARLLADARQRFPEDPGLAAVARLVHLTDAR